MIWSLATYFQACEWEFDEDEGAVVRPVQIYFRLMKVIALSGQRKCLKNKKVKQEYTNFPEM